MKKITILMLMMVLMLVVNAKVMAQEVKFDGKSFGMSMDAVKKIDPALVEEIQDGETFLTKSAILNKKETKFCFDFDSKGKFMRGRIYVKTDCIYADLNEKYMMKPYILLFNEKYGDCKDITRSSGWIHYTWRSNGIEISLNAMDGYPRFQINYLNRKMFDADNGVKSLEECL